MAWENVTEALLWFYLVNFVFALGVIFIGLVWLVLS